MNVPFSTSEFFEVFEQYNIAVFPVQILLLLAGLLFVIFINHHKPPKNKLIGFYLGFLWLWGGSVYHLKFFTEINLAAYFFAALFLLQGIFFTVETIRGKLTFTLKRNFRSLTGLFFVLFGLLIYPLISYLLEGSPEKTITIGLPCPTTILTFGFLMLSGKKLSRYLLIIPSLWAVIGTGAAINFGIVQDYFMIVTALIADFMLLLRKK